MYLFFFFFFFFLSRAALMAYGTSQARGQIGAVAAATPDLSHICDPHHSSWQHLILNPLSETRDRTCVLKDINHSFLLSRARNVKQGILLYDHNYQNKEINVYIILLSDLPKFC